MNLNSLTKKFNTLRHDIKKRYWPKLVTELETKSLRSLFLWALLIGFILSVPWQCTRLLYNGYFSQDQTVQLNHGDALTSPDQNNTSVTKMPNPKARRPIPTITQPKNEPIAPEVVAESPNTVPAIQSDHEAKVISQTIPKYPTNIFRKNVSGTVVLKVLIDSTGSTQDITIDKSSESKSLDRAARKAVSEWKFSPKIANGVAVPSELLIPIEFKAEQ